MKNKLSIIVILVIIISIIVLGIRFLSGEDNWMCKNGQWIKHGNPSSVMPTSSCEGVLENYKIVKVMEASCQKDSECITPGVYLMQSSCSYTSICLKNKCTVICPNYIQTSTSSTTTEVDETIEYRNTQYGFSFLLPISWKGYSIVTDVWEGNLVDIQTNQKYEGPKILIRHLLWSSINPRQDIPIMIFTLEQWDLIQQEKLSVSAAPIGPSELGRNEKYVFALPARYNMHFKQDLKKL